MHLNLEEVKRPRNSNPEDKGFLRGSGATASPVQTIGVGLVVAVVKAHIAGKRLRSRRVSCGLNTGTSLQNW